jgi:xanthine dehydrogenase accessory factor
MEKKLIFELARCLENNEHAALVTVTDSNGSSPAKTGAMMLVRGDGSTVGTVGGGSLEHTTIEESLDCLKKVTNRELNYTLSQDSVLAMSCGGEVRLFVKVFQPDINLLVVGGGHIGFELYVLAKLQGFHVVVFDDRKDFVTKERFPEAELVISDDIPAALEKYALSENCYIAIATSTHETDKLCLAAVANSPAPYIGMIGSTRKIKGTLQYLQEVGVTKEKIDKLFTPMGLNIATIKPKEIAVSILSEILLVKNSGSAEHMRKVKRIDS